MFLLFIWAVFFFSLKFVFLCCNKIIIKHHDEKKISPNHLIRVRYLLFFFLDKNDSFSPISFMYFFPVNILFFLFFDHHHHIWFIICAGHAGMYVSCVCICKRVSSWTHTQKKFFKIWSFYMIEKKIFFLVSREKNRCVVCMCVCIVYWELSSNVFLQIWYVCCCSCCCRYILLLLLNVIRILKTWMQLY